MLKIRMQRIGRKNDPSYRVVVAEHTRGPKAGNFLERVGSYHPKTKERTLDTERIKHWMSVGAKPSDTVHNMLISAGIISGEKINVLPKKTPIVKEEAPAEEKAAEEASAAETETTTEEAVAEEAATATEDTKEAESEAPAEEEKTEETPAA